MNFKNIGFSVMVILAIQNSSAQVLPYISPGFTVAWNSSKLKSASWKISVGIFSPGNTDKLDGYFCNITLGKRYLLDDYSKDYLFTECESGIFKGYLFYGSGIGTAYIRQEEKTRVVPKFSLFTGDILFLRSDMIINHKKIDLDIGGTLVLPLNKSYIDHIRHTM